MSVPNLNALWARTLIGALYHAGVRDVCITPGSRSTPLAIAAHQQDGWRSYVHIDERASAFFALGLAKATGRPVALVCTSGTAAANYFPAVIEASLTGVPLIVLTADRPLGLRQTGSPQTIDQVRLFGHYVRTYLETPLPEPNVPSLRRLAAGAVQICAVATGTSAGPVHLNVPFNDPLPPIPSGDPALPSLEEALAGFSSTVAGARTLADESALRTLAERLQAGQRGLIVAGPGAAVAGAEWVFELSRRTGFPVIADAASGVRFEPALAVVRCAHADAFLRAQAMADQAPDVVLKIGGLPTSAILNAYLNRWRPWTAVIQTDLERRDPEALLSLLVQGELAEALERLCGMLGEQGRVTEWQEIFRIAEQTASEAIAQAGESPVEGLSVRAAIAAMPADGAVFLSNSMPIRYAESLAGVGEPGLKVLVSRGANGIDGIASTAFGIAAGLAAPTLLVTGDLAFLHDLGGLLAARHLRTPFVILLLNNDGGAIFSHLPISRFPQVFEPLFGTPHGLTFEPAARMFGLEHVTASSPAHVAQLMVRALESECPTVIEVPTDRVGETEAYQALIRRIAEAVDGALSLQGAVR